MTSTKVQRPDSIRSRSLRQQNLSRKLKNTTLLGFAKKMRRKDKIVYISMSFFAIPNNKFRSCNDYYPRQTRQI